MKTLLASTAIAMTMAGTAFAEQHTMTEGTGSEPFVGSIENQALRASDLLGSRLYVSEAEVEDGAGMSEDWNDVGEISDIILGNDGEIDAVVADIGGFLGIGERTVAVNMDDLQFVSDGENADDYFIVLSGVTQEGLENAPEFEDDFETGRTADTAMGTEAGMGTDTETGAMATEGETEMDAAETDMEQAGDAVEETAEDAGREMEQAGDEVEQAADDAGDEMNEEMTETETETAADADATATEGTDGEMAADSDAAMTEGSDTEMATETDGTMTEGTDSEMAADGTMTEETDPAMTGTATGLNTAPAMEREGYATVASTDLTTEDVTGAPVYGVNDDRIGEIGELVMSEDGQLSEAIVDVGGFLGLGEKPVAVPFDNLQIMQSESDVRIYIDATQEQLEGLPEYEG